MTVGIGVTCLMVIGLLATGCAGRSSYPDAGQSPTASSRPSQSAATIGGELGGELGAPTARRIVDELATAGFEVPKPRDLRRRSRTAPDRDDRGVLRAALDTR
ncbi:MAG: hypothetical protein HYZ38_23145 [Mycobacterium sp.]|nr:hypothetical protein [Mycobacterium sp.]